MTDVIRRLPTARLALLLAALLVAGQLFIAVHEPSHIHTGTDIPLQLLVQDDCQLGAQAHAPGLPPALVTTRIASARLPWHNLTAVVHPFDRTLRPLARAPPLPA